MELRVECARLRHEVADWEYIADHGPYCEIGKLRAEVGRLHSLLERARELQVSDTVTATIIWEETRRLRAENVEVPREVYESKGDELQEWLVTRLNDGYVEGVATRIDGHDFLLEVEEAYVESDR